MVGTILRIICPMFDIYSYLFHNMLSHHTGQLRESTNSISQSSLVDVYAVCGHLDLSVLCNLHRLTRWFWQGPGVGVFRDRDRVQLCNNWTSCLVYEFTNIKNKRHIETSILQLFALLASFTFCQALHCSVFTELQRCVQANPLWSQKPGE